MWPFIILLCILLHLSETSIEQKFPPWFKFGSASSSYQVEGAWNISDKGENRWDRLTHTTPEIIKDLTNGDVACDSYHLWKRDIEMAAQLGLQFYRFSINWARLLPNGFSNKISEDGKRYYNNLIDGLLEKGIEPIVTLYHFELPQIFVELGGWTNPLSSDWYAEYARVVFTLYGDRVKTWITINEPQLECDMVIRMAASAGLKNPPENNMAPYLCNKYILIAHAKAWRIYDEEFRDKYNGKVSITNHLLWLTPASPQDAELTETARQFDTGRYSHPIYSIEGGWPPIVEEKVYEESRQNGYTRSILPPFTQEEIQLVRGTYDFYGINYYTTRLVRPAREGEKVDKSIFNAVATINAVYETNPAWKRGYNKDLPVNPEGIRQQMHWLDKHYGNLEYLITENGYSSTGHKLNDEDRIAFIKGHLEQILLSINEGLNVTGYSYWSLMDDFEWFDGYSSNFGLYQVNFTDPMRPRIPRKSSFYYSNVIKSRSLNVVPNKLGYSNLISNKS